MLVSATPVNTCTFIHHQVLLTTLELVQALTFRGQSILPFPAIFRSQGCHKNNALIITLQK